jgi:hypothetical protein
LGPQCPDVLSRKEGSGGGMKLIPYIHLVPRLRMSGPVPLFHPYALMAWAGTSPVMMMMMMMMMMMIVIDEI